MDFGKPDPEDLKVLFIGSSYLAVNDMPGIFQGLAEAAEKDVFVAGRVQSGYYLDFFAQDETTARANSTGPGGGSRGDGLEGGHGVGHP